MKRYHRRSLPPPPQFVRLALLLASPVRWAMLYELALHDLVSVKHLAAISGLTSSAASMHVRVLKKTRIIEQGMGRLYRLTAAYRPPPGQDYLDFGMCRLMLPPKA